MRSIAVISFKYKFIIKRFFIILWLCYKKSLFQQSKYNFWLIDCIIVMYRQLSKRICIILNPDFWFSWMNNKERIRTIKKECKLLWKIWIMSIFWPPIVELNGILLDAVVGSFHRLYFGLWFLRKNSHFVRIVYCSILCLANKKVG